MYHVILHGHKKEQNWVICRDIDGHINCHTKWSLKEKNKGRILMHIRGIYKNGIDDLTCKTETDAENVCTPSGEGEVGWIGKLGLTYTHRTDSPCNTVETNMTP